MQSSDVWLKTLGNLRLHRARGDPAPHKPLLLLAVIDLAQEGDLPDRVLPLSPELAFRFCNYWSVVAHRRRQKPDVRLPFHHLSTDGFWSALDEDGRASPARRVTVFAELNPDFVAFLSDPAMRRKARTALVERYFRPSEQVALRTILGLRAPVPEELEPQAAYSSVAEARNAGREARFRVTVVAAYGYTCALTRRCLTTIAVGSIVEAAHIHPFSDSRNNEPQNGMALARDAHWLFDRGLWSITDDYRVIVAVGKFVESSPNARGLCDYHGEPLHLPEDRAIWPSPVHLAWHRKHVFEGY